MCQILNVFRARYALKHDLSLRDFFFTVCNEIISRKAHLICHKIAIGTISIEVSLLDPGRLLPGRLPGRHPRVFLPSARYVDLLPNYCMPFTFIIPEDYSRYDMIIGGRPVFLLRAILIVPFF